MLILLKKVPGILLLCLFSLLASGQEDDFRVMTFNIRYDNPQDGQYCWAMRKGMVEEVFKRCNPGIIGVQEALQGQIGDLGRMLPGYQYTGVGRDDGKKAGEYSAIFYDTVRFSPLAGSTFWLSGTPEKPGSSSWNSACTRIATWVKLLDRRSGMTLLVCNTHFDHVSNLARTMSAALILEFIKESAENLPVILMGDFNSTDTSRAYVLLTDPGSRVTLSDSRKMAVEQVLGPDFTFVGFPYHPDPAEMIDFIFFTADRGLYVKKLEVSDYHISDKYPSDHLPVVATFSYSKNH